MLFFLFFSKAGCKNGQAVQETIKVRVANNSDVAFTRVALFSMDFGGLNPGNVSDYKILDFDPFRDDSLLYCTQDDYTHSTYVQMPDKDSGNYTYSIDSIRNKLVYISIELD
ncbi:hypothetical protein [Flagellimonas iocasae]|uniref:GOLD domain-containing protein n=1 Tax=Flagellimonas iocasae TaxID=2055905 RepID=A0ABW4XUY9_9FLAO